jgi:hypothetical protein
VQISAFMMSRLFEKVASLFMNEAHPRRPGSGEEWTLFCATGPDSKLTLR